MPTLKPVPAAPIVPVLVSGENSSAQLGMPAAGVSSEAFRRHVLNLLMVIAALSVLRALWALLG